LQGALVSVWTNSGKGTSLGSGTTDSAGQLLIDLGARTSFYYEVTGTRFTMNSDSPTITLGDTLNITMSAASGYECVTGCAQPEPDTMHATHPVFGALTFAWSGGPWIATKNYSFPGFGGCGAKTVAVTCVWDSGNYYEQWKYDGSDCPDNAGATTATANWTPGAQVCYIPSVSSFSQAYTITPAAGHEANFYQTTSPLVVSMIE
jgi:hypothetical protein